MQCAWVATSSITTGQVCFWNGEGRPTCCCMSSCCESICFWSACCCMACRACSCGGAKRTPHTETVKVGSASAKDVRRPPSHTCWTCSALLKLLVFFSRRRPGLRALGTYQHLCIWAQPCYLIGISLRLYPSACLGCAAHRSMQPVNRACTCGPCCGHGCCACDGCAPWSGSCSWIVSWSFWSSSSPANGTWTSPSPSLRTGCCEGGFFPLESQLRILSIPGWARCNNPPRALGCAPQ